MDGKVVSNGVCVPQFPTFKKSFAEKKLFLVQTAVCGQDLFKLGHVAGSNSDESGDVPDSDGLYWSLGLGPQLMKLAKNLGTVWIYFSMHQKNS